MSKNYFMSQSFKEACDTFALSRTIYQKLSAHVMVAIVPFG
jgi:hypothetical protein